MASSYSKGVVIRIRVFFSVLVFGLLLSTLFPVAQIKWTADILHAASGDSGANQAGDFSDTGAATDSEDDSPQETPDGGVISRLSASDCESRRFLALMNKIPPATLLVSQLLHPPTTQS
ncbi:MAG: hypothetical protein HOP32_18090 [Nitrospira sp.]|nr:hypothetical protein [Nitrospira sp.]